MTLRLVPHAPDAGAQWWTPFAANPEFRWSRWTEQQRPPSLCAYWGVEQDGIEVTRVELDFNGLQARFRNFPGFLVAPARIQLIETAITCRRKGFGAATVELLQDAYPGKAFIAFSVDADRFWEGIGWSRYINVDDDPAAPRMSPLYVAPH